MNEMHSKLLSTDLNLLITLHALLETASVSEAARWVGRSQSAVSHGLNRLRAEFDDPLLVRKGRAMRLTPRAEEMKRDLAGLVDLLTGIVSRGADFDPVTSGRAVRVACHDIGMPLLMPVFADLAQLAPRMPITLVQTSSAVEAVRCGEADLGLTFRDPPSDTGLAYVDLGALDWGTFGVPTHPFLTTGGFDDWLAARHVVVGSGQMEDGPIDVALKQMRQRRTIAMRVTSFTAALATLEEMDAVFTTLVRPFEALGTRLGLSVRAAPIPLPVPQVRIVMPIREDPFHRFLATVVQERFAGSSQ